MPPKVSDKQRYDYEERKDRRYIKMRKTCLSLAHFMTINLQIWGV